MKKDRGFQTRKANKEGSSAPLRVVHPDAAGIDIGSHKHYVAVPPERDKEPVRRFGCLTPDVHAMARWLRVCGVKTVEMESMQIQLMQKSLEQMNLQLHKVLSESGLDMSRFATEKHYSSWLGLCPNHQITGGKIRRRRTRRVHNRAATALRVAAQSLHKSKTALGAFYRRMRGRVGPAKAITATAHKLAILMYRMLKYGMKYVEKGQQVYDQHYQRRTLQMLAKRVKRMGYLMVDPRSAEVVS